MQGSVVGRKDVWVRSCIFKSYFYAFHWLKYCHFVRKTVNDNASITHKAHCLVDVMDVYKLLLCCSLSLPFIDFANEIWCRC